MENSFQTSFIPKKPVIGGTKTASTAKVGFFTIASVFLLIASGAAAGGLFLYKSSLLAKEKVLSDSLTQASNNFNKDTISELELYNQRVKVSKTILDGHIVLSPLFTLIGQLTIPSVQYTKFDHKTDEHGYSVAMTGIAHDYKGIALQADSFNSPAGSLLKNVVFSNLQKDLKGNVTFDLSFTVDPSLLSYEKNNAIQTQVTPSTQNTTPSPVVQSVLPDTTTNTGTPSVPNTTN